MPSGCLREGTYRLALKVHDDGSAAAIPLSLAAPEDGDTAMAILRGGHTLGSGRWGGVFHGSHSFDRSTGLNHIHITLEVPPERCLVTGFCAGAEGALVDIVGAVRSDGRGASAVVEVAGAPLEVALIYLAPPPG